MIKARAVIRDGFYQVDFRGHGARHVCSAASMLVHAAALGLRDLAAQFPDEIKFAEDVDFQGQTESLDSKAQA